MTRQIGVGHGAAACTPRLTQPTTGRARTRIEQQRNRRRPAGTCAGPGSPSSRGARRCGRSGAGTAPAAPAGRPTAPVGGGDSARAHTHKARHCSGAQRASLCARAVRHLPTPYAGSVRTVGARFQATGRSDEGLPTWAYSTPTRFGSDQTRLNPDPASKLGSVPARLSRIRIFHSDPHFRTPPCRPCDRPTRHPRLARIVL